MPFPFPQRAWRAPVQDEDRTAIPYVPVAPEALRALAELLTYPEAGHVERLAVAVATLEPAEPSLAEGADALLGWARTVSLEEAQEVFARTFDLNPACTLDVGWHVFGETYKRGALLVGLRETMRAHGLEEGTELPDHLPQVLRLLAVMPVVPGDEDDEAELLRRFVVGPALRAIALKFHGSMHPYAPVLRTAASRLGPDLRSLVHLPVIRPSADSLEGNHA